MKYAEVRMELCEEQVGSNQPQQLAWLELELN